MSKPTTMNQEQQTVKVATASEMRRIRYESSLAALKLSPAKAHAQMRKNGSVSSPNPWYLGPNVKGGSLTLLSSKS